MPIRSLPPVARFSDIRPGRVSSTLTEALAEAPTPTMSAHLLTQTIELLPPYRMALDSSLLAAVDLLSHPGVSVQTAALESGLSVRELRRRFVDQVGLPPKTFQRVARFQQFRRLVANPRSPRTLAQTAAQCGYTDQAHLAHDCQQLANRTPTAIANAVKPGAG
jgi:AraC-like DNA-binding protein